MTENELQLQVARAAYNLLHSDQNIVPTLLNGLMNMTTVEMLSTADEETERRERLYQKTKVIGELQQNIENLAAEFEAYARERQQNG